MVNFSRVLKNGKAPTFIVQTVASKLMQNNVDILKALSKHGTGLYVTVNHPYKKLSETLERKHVDMSDIFFIDCITRTAGGEAKKTDHCLFVASPRGLTELSIAITHAIKALPKGRKFLVFDALSTLIIYNSPETLAKFSHFIMSKAKLLGVTSVFMVVSKEVNETFIAQMEQFADKVIKVDGGNN